MAEIPIRKLKLEEVPVDSSVAMVATDAFRKKLNYEPRKLAKTMRIFVEMEHIRNQGVTFWPERIRWLPPTLWSGHKI
jgi:hypothetical protein